MLLIPELQEQATLSEFSSSWIFLEEKHSATLNGSSISYASTSMNVCQFKYQNCCVHFHIIENKDLSSSFLQRILNATSQPVIYWQKEASHSQRMLRMQCSHLSSPLLSLHAILAETGTGLVLRHQCTKSSFQCSQKLASPILSCLQIPSCLFQEVWPSASILSVVMNCIWIMAAPPSSYLPRQLESLCPVFLHFFFFFISTPHQHSFFVSGWSLQIGLLSTCWKSLVEENSLEHKSIW